MTEIQIPPNPGPGRPPQSYYDELENFADSLEEMQNEELDFKMSARGWAYYFENEGLIDKSELDFLQKKINDCRDRGYLPLDFVAKDDSREFHCVEDDYDSKTPEEYVEWRLNHTTTTQYADRYVSFWDTQDHFIQVIVEKVDLRELFDPICREYDIPIATGKGWSSKLQRGKTIARFYKHGCQGRQPVLLYCGDFDPAGMQISDKLKKNLADLEDAKIPVEGSGRFGGDYITGWTPDNLIVDRFGLNRDFIEDADLTWIDNLKTSSGKDLANPSHNDHDQDYVQDWLDDVGARKVEANALVTQPELGRTLFRNTIEKYLGPNPKEKYNQKVEEKKNDIDSLFSELGVEEQHQEWINEITT